MTLKQLTLILTRYSLLFPNSEFSELTFGVWHDLFSAEDPKMFQAGVRAAVMQHGRSFFPAPGEVNEELSRIKYRRPPAPQPYLPPWERPESKHLYSEESAQKAKEKVKLLVENLSKEKEIKK